MTPSSEPLFELPGTLRPAPKDARVVERWPRRDPLELTVLLRRSPAADPLPTMATLGSLGISRRTYLSRDEFASRHAASLEDVSRVREHVERYGLTLTEVDRARRALKIAGTAEDVARAFGVELWKHAAAGMTYRSAAGPVRLPRAVGGVVVGVFGLDNRSVVRPHFRRNTDPAAVGYSVPVVGSAYAFPEALSGAGECIGVLEFGGGFAAGDLTRYFEALGRAPPTVVPVSVDGVSNAPTGNANGPDAEVELDIEVAGALAPDASIAVYFAPNTDQGFVDALTTAVHDATRHPSVVSISWGGPEQSWAAQTRSAMETAAQDGAVQGVTILAASGDQGASDGEPAGTLAVDFPASSPYVLGCGGTRLELSGSTIVSEVVWNDLAQGEGATGGGVSEDFAVPSYQATAEVPPAPNGFDGRGVPDVAANADPTTGYSVIVDGSPAVIGGTSASAPLWAALMALLNQAMKKPLGYANPLLYPLAVSRAFHEITSGDNDGYSARAGWNPCTGLGTPNGTALLAGLETGTSPSDRTR